GRNDGLFRTQRGLCVVAVGIGDLQLVDAAALDDEGDAGRERALRTAELFADAIRHLVGGGTPAVGRRREAHAVDLGLLDGVDHAVPHVVLFRGGLRTVIGVGVGFSASPHRVVYLRVDIAICASGSGGGDQARAGQGDTYALGQLIAL